MEATFHAMRFLCVGEVVAFVGRGQPHPRFLAGIEDDLLGEAEPEIVLEKFAVRPYVDRQAIEVIEPSHVDAARGIALRLVLQRRAKRVRGLIPFGLVIDLDDMPVGLVEAIGGSVAELAVAPADPGPGAFDRLHAPLKRLRAPRPERGVSQTRRM
jgi:hypothetical protein